MEDKIENKVDVKTMTREELERIVGIVLDKKKMAKLIADSYEVAGEKLKEKLKNKLIGLDNIK